MDSLRPDKPPIRRRRRQALTCENCRKRKVKCDRLQPCSNCTRAQRPAECHYQAETLLPRLPPAARPTNSPAVLAPLPALPSLSRATGPSPETETSLNHPRHSPSSPNTTSTNPSSNSEVVLLAERVKELETQLSLTLAAAQTNVSGPLTQDPTQKAPDRSMRNVDKAHYYGESFWMHLVPMFTVLVDIFASSTDHSSSVTAGIRKCKSCARLIKSHRARVLNDLNYANIPAREVCDQLVDAYLRTFESVYRILHITTFYADYNKYWEEPVASSDAFVNQLKLVLAIGACFHDDSFDMRGMAVRWIQDVHSWLLLPFSALKSRLIFSTLQIMCLMHIARQTTGLGADLVWISAGELVRMAIYMGLHRDPDHLVKTRRAKNGLAKMPRLRAELRRRLWATIMEIALQASIEVGGPATISLSDFDTRPPSNLDDIDLREPTDAESDLERPHDSRPADCFTQTSVQIALYRSFPTRLAIAQYLNDFRRTSCYDTTLRLNADLTAAMRGLSRVFNSYKARGRGQPSDFQLLLVDHVMQSFSLALHLPWKAPSQRDPRYYFSRKVSVETALKLPQPFIGDDNDHEGIRSQSVGFVDFRRLATCGAGTFRTIPWQCAMILGLELIWQREDNRVIRTDAGRCGGSATTLPGPDKAGGETSFSQSVAGGLGVVAATELISALENVLDWGTRRITAGDTNIRGIVMISGVLAQAEALRLGYGDDNVRKLADQAMVNEVAICYERLRAAAAHVGIDPDSAGKVQNGANPTNSESTTTGRRDKIGEREQTNQEVDTLSTSTPEELFLAFGGMATDGLPPGMDTNWTWDDFMDIERLDFDFPNGSGPMFAPT